MKQQLVWNCEDDESDVDTSKENQFDSVTMGFVYSNFKTDQIPKADCEGEFNRVLDLEVVGKARGGVI